MPCLNGLSHSIPPNTLSPHPLVDHLVIPCTFQPLSTGSNQDPMHELPISLGAQSPITTESPSIQASNLFGDMEIGSGETSLMMLMFSAHAKKASSVRKRKQPMSSKGAHTHTSTSPVSSQGGSGTCKHSHNLTTNISTKITNTSNIPLHHI